MLIKFYFPFKIRNISKLFNLFPFLKEQCFFKEQLTINRYRKYPVRYCGIILMTFLFKERACLEASFRDILCS